MELKKRLSDTTSRRAASRMRSRLTRSVTPTPARGATSAAASFGMRRLSGREPHESRQKQSSIDRHCSNRRRRRFHCVVRECSEQFQVSERLRHHGRICKRGDGVGERTADELAEHDEGGAIERERKAVPRACVRAVALAQSAGRILKKEGAEQAPFYLAYQFFGIRAHETRKNEDHS